MPSRVDLVLGITAVPEAAVFLTATLLQVVMFAKMEITPLAIVRDMLSWKWIASEVVACGMVAYLKSMVMVLSFAMTILSQNSVVRIMHQKK